jgi:hypothetical protein
MACDGEVVGALGWDEGAEGNANGVPEAIERSHGRFAQQRLELGKAFSIGLKSGVYGGSNGSWAPAFFLDPIILPEPSLLRLFAVQLQPRPLPNPPDALDVHHPTRRPQQGCDPEVAMSDDVGGQCRLISPSFRDLLKGAPNVIVVRSDSDVETIDSLMELALRCSSLICAETWRIRG